MMPCARASYRDVFEPDEPRAASLVKILVSEEPEGRREWLHTRGLRQVGRPDLSAHHVAPEHRAGIEECFHRFIEHQLRGLIIDEGAEVRMNGVPLGLVCRHGGSLEDPDFNNLHVELERTF